MDLTIRIQIYFLRYFLFQKIYNEITPKLSLDSEYCIFLIIYIYKTVIQQLIWTIKRPYVFFTKTYIVSIFFLIYKSSASSIIKKGLKKIAIVRNYWDTFKVHKKIRTNGNWQLYICENKLFKLKFTNVIRTDIFKMFLY